MRSHHPWTIPSHKRGFALVVTLSLMILLTVIAVGLLTLSGIALRSSSLSNDQKTAQANARMALMLAIGQLQTYAGPDQRSTATANLAGDKDCQQLTAGGTAQNTYGADGTTVNGLVGPQAGTRHWTGVWGNYHAPTDIFTKTPVPVLLNWLVSGNETAPAFTTNATTGQITSASITAPLPPSMSVANLGAASTALSNNLTINNQPAVLLAGPNTVVGSASTPVADDVDRYVAAPVVPIKGADGTTTVGGYAWWVGDEGVKARYDVVDPYSDKTTPATQVEARYRLNTPAHSGVELLGTTLAANYPAPTAVGKTTHEQLAKVIDMPQARLLSPSIAEAELKNRYHALSASSIGLLTDTQNGGLRQDLSYYMGQSTLGSPLLGTKIIPTAYSPKTGPYWDHLHSFCNAPVTGSGTTATVRCRPQTATQMGINPFISQFQFLLTTNNPAANATSCKIRCNFLVVLANPYNVTLTAPAGGANLFFKEQRKNVGIKGSITLWGVFPSTWAAWSATTPRPSSPTVADFYYGITRSQLLPYPVPADPEDRGLMDAAKFHIADFSIPPGEAIVLSVKGSNQTIDSHAATGTQQVELEACDASSAYLPASGTFSSNYYEDSTPLNLIKTTPTVPAVAPDPVGTACPAGTVRIYWSRTGNGGSGAGASGFSVSMRDAADGVLQGVCGENVNSGGTAAFVTPAFANMYLFAMQPTAVRYPGGTGQATGSGGAFWSNFRIYQDFNVRGVSLNMPDGYASNSVIPCSTYAAPAGANAVAAFGKIPLTGPLWAEHFDTSLRGSTVAPKGVLFDLPRSDLPLFSLGQLQHASLTADDNDVSPTSAVNIPHPYGGIWTQPGYAVANSYSHPFVPRALASQVRNVQTTNKYFDISYLLNTSLWDNYYFSSIPQTGLIYAPLNPRYQLLPDQATAAQVRQPDAAQHLSINGAFNINSTDPEAWKAVLGGLNNINTPTDPVTPTVTGAVFARSIWQPGTSINSKAGTGLDAYAGVRRLTASELDNLAKAIVQRVRARGPFVSLAHFVNRTLVAGSKDFNPVINDATFSGALAATASIPQGRGFSGPLQAAIDAAGQTVNPATPAVTATLSGGLNDFGGGSSANKVTPSAGKSGAMDLGDRICTQETVTNKFGDTPSDKEYNSAIYYDMTQVAAPGPRGRTSTGIPGWLMQGDVLQSIGSVLSARSDTFVIRSYGEARDASGKVTAKAWCEAVVQRVPDYLDGAATGNPANAVRASLTTTNQKFGRRFKLVSFRWLTPNDI